MLHPVRCITQSFPYNIVNLATARSGQGGGEEAGGAGGRGEDGGGGGGRGVKGRWEGEEDRPGKDREGVEDGVGGSDESAAGTHKVVKVGRLREIGVFNIGGTLY